MDSMHKKAMELLPWYVNGALTESERVQVESHLRDCLPCRAALKRDERMRILIGDQADDPKSPEHDMAALMSRIDRGTANNRMHSQRAARVGQLGWGLAVVATVALFAVLVLRPATGPGSVTGDFSTLTNAPVTASNRIGVVLSDNVEEAQIFDIVENLGGQLESGPSDLGYFTIILPTGDDASVQAAIDVLSADPRTRFVGRNFTGGPNRAEGDP